MPCERGDVLLVPFPFTDRSSGKRRPVLALTQADHYGDFVGLPVTSRPHHVHGLALQNHDLATGSLPVPSWVRTDRVVTLNASLVVKSIGRVEDAYVDQAVRLLCAYLHNSA